jgi:hypothetical protein
VSALRTRTREQQQHSVCRTCIPDGRAKHREEFKPTRARRTAGGGIDRQTVSDIAHADHVAQELKRDHSSIRGGLRQFCSDSCKNKEHRRRLCNSAVESTRLVNSRVTVGVRACGMIVTSAQHLRSLGGFASRWRRALGVQGRRTPRVRWASLLAMGEHRTFDTESLCRRCRHCARTLEGWGPLGVLRVQGGNAFGDASERIATPRHVKSTDQKHHAPCIRRFAGMHWR